LISSDNIFASPVWARFGSTTRAAMGTAGASLANGMSYWISKNLSKPQEAT
jgi:hypothetical protein